MSWLLDLRAIGMNLKGMMGVQPVGTPVRERYGPVATSRKVSSSGNEVGSFIWKGFTGTGENFSLTI